MQNIGSLVSHHRSRSMWKVLRILIRAPLMLAVCSFAAQTPASIGELAQAFAHPPDDSRIMIRWWWFGPRVTKTELEREMRQMRAAGIGGFEVQPVYPLEIEGNDSYLSPEFLDDLRFTA